MVQLTSSPDSLQPSTSQIAPQSVAPLVEPESSEPASTWVGLKVFTSTFVTIFLAELGDKTQITTLLMSAESHQPWLVFLGAGTALVTASLFGVLLGQWIASRLSPRTLETTAGIVLLLVSLLLLGDVVRG
ncbi:hypothetical protein BST81_17880 [Leptolyngbya sp. 'hensonii']|nr:hypothetical protein BST81_17880 [Leptolyngbya sp. 'hensonii']